MLMNFDEMFDDNAILVEKMKRLAYVYNIRNGKVGSAIKNNQFIEDHNVDEFKKLSDKQLNSQIISTNKLLRDTNELVLKNIYEYINYMTSKKSHPLSSVNYKAILEISQKHNFAEFLIVSLIFATLNTEEDFIYFEKNIITLLDIGYNDIIYYIYTNKFLNKYTTIYARNKIKTIIESYALNRLMINCLYMAAQNYILTGEGKDHKSIARILRNIPDYWVNIRMSDAEPEIIDSLEYIMLRY